MQNKKRGNKFMQDKKGQAWGFDLMVAIIIFTFGIVVFFIYSVNQPAEAKETLEKLSYDGKLITNAILSEGHPKGWNESNVVKIGILNDNKINQTKLESFYSLAQTDYPNTKQHFNTVYDYYFFLDENMTIDSLEVEGIGKPGTNKNNIDSENIVKITRFTVYGNKPMVAYLYIFE